MDIPAYCFRCRVHTSTVDVDIVRTTKGRPRLVGVCGMCGANKSQFIKKSYASEIEGEGILELAKNAIHVLFHGARRDVPPKFRDTLSKYHDETIKKLIIRRQPIQKGVKTLVDILSLGKLSKNQKKLHYDDLYHLSMIIVLSSGKLLLLEKNAVPNLIILIFRISLLIL